MIRTRSEAERRAARVMAGLAGVLLVRALAVPAQEPTPAARRDAAPVSLRLTPRLGDTLVIRVDQTARLSSTRSGAGGGTSTDSTATAMTEMHLFSHAVVASRDAAGTILDAVTDSVQIRSRDERAQAANARTEEQLRGQRVRMRIAPDGSISVVGNDNRQAKALADAASLIPATFPTDPVALGQRWIREMTIPVGTTALGMAMGGLVRAEFSLDSTARAGQLAYVSVHGTFRPSGSPSHAGSRALESGSVSGSLVIDRSRGWLAESAVTVVAQSSMLPLAGFAGSGVTLQMVIEQKTRLFDKK